MANLDALSKAYTTDTSLKSLLVYTTHFFRQLPWFLRSALFRYLAQAQSYVEGDVPLSCPD